MQAQLSLDEIPYGFCHCGCGERTKIASRTERRGGLVRGEPQRYVRGHGARKYGPDSYEVRDCGYETPCWVWRGSMLSGPRSGYGVASRNGRPIAAHRLVYELHNGLVPDGLELDHLCRNRACVNPAHLEPVAHVENMRRGAGTKLTADQVLEIRALAQQGVPQRQIAEHYGIWSTHVSAIHRRVTWADLPDQ